MRQKKKTLSFHYSTLFHFCQVKSKVSPKANLKINLLIAIAISFLILSVLPLFHTTPTYATEAPKATLSSDQIGAISVGCASIKTSLVSLQKADSATRVHLGTTYQNILSHYLTPLNLRLVKANRLSDNLNNILTEFSNQRNDFNQQFVTYSRQLENLISADCQSQPEEFYTLLESTRTERAKTATLASDLRKTLDKHVSAVKELKL